MGLVSPLISASRQPHRLNLAHGETQRRGMVVAGGERQTDRQTERRDRNERWGEREGRERTGGGGG